MASSLITKKKITKAFKELLENKSFDKISIVDIMEHAHIRRQTFYNHFIDKYELLDWIFETDLQEQITDNLDYISGRQLLKELFLYFDHNKKFYMQLFAIKGQNDFYSFFIDYCKVVVTKIFNEYAKQHTRQNDDSFKQFHLDYHAHALANIVKTFVCSTTPIPNTDYFIHEIAN